MIKKILFLLVTVCLLQLVVAGETRNIEYSINISFFPYCINEQCHNETTSTFDNSTNITTNYTKTICSANCYGKINVNGIDNNKLFFEIDIGSDRWKNGSTELRYGYKEADLGNLSDISGIRQELQNLTSCFGNNALCIANLTEMQVKESVCQTNLADKNVISKELNDWKGTKKWYFLVAGILIGALFIWRGLPLIQGKKNPRAPTEQLPSNIPYR
jgi:hypothetical protein